MRRGPQRPKETPGIFDSSTAIIGDTRDLQPARHSPPKAEPDTASPAPSGRADRAPTNECLASLKAQPGDGPASTARRKADGSSRERHAAASSRPRCLRGGRAGSTPTGTPQAASSVVVRGISRLSNRKLVRNAISFLCLAGGHVKDQKERVLQVRKRPTLVTRTARAIKHGTKLQQNTSW